MCNSLIKYSVSIWWILKGKYSYSGSLLRHFSTVQMAFCFSSAASLDIMRSNEVNGTLVGNAFPCLQYFLTEQLHSYLSPLCNIPQTELAFLGFFHRSLKMKNRRILRTLDAHGSRVLKRIHSVRRLGRCALESAASEFNSRDMTCKRPHSAPASVPHHFPGGGVVFEERVCQLHRHSLPVVWTLVLGNSEQHGCSVSGCGEGRNVRS